MFFFFQAEDGIRDYKVTGVQTCALPIYRHAPVPRSGWRMRGRHDPRRPRRKARHSPLPAGHRWRTERCRSEEHTSELQSPCNLVCRLLLEKKKKMCNIDPTERVIHPTRCTIA